MNRRDFLKLSGSMLAVAYLAVGPIRHIAKLPVEKTAASGKIYRGTPDGSIHVSADDGQSWQEHTRFGPGYSILDIFTGLDGRTYVEAGFKGRTFHLVLSKNERAWLTQSLNIAMLHMP